MKRYHFFKTIILSLGLLAAVFSCTGIFEDYNTHPTKPGDNDGTAPERIGVLFPEMLYLMHNFQENRNQHFEQMVLNQYGGYMVTTNNWQGQNFGTFNPNPDWVASPFNTHFTGFYANFLKVKSATQEKGYIYAWANVIRAAVMLRVVDTYGPIPYSKMGLGQVAVEYDDVQDVYHYIIEDLDNSIAVLTNFVAEHGGEETPMDQFDLVYKGDFSKWIKFANSLKLRMAVRIALVDTNYAIDVMNSAIAGGLIEANEDNAFLPTKDNPYYKSAFDWRDLAASATLTSYLNGWNDPRRTVYITNDQFNRYAGVRMGINNINQSWYGVIFAKPNFATDSPLPVYCAAETFFLKAEAALRGWVPGDAGALYEQGIRASMQQHRVEIGDYLSVTENPQSYADVITALHNFNIASAENGGDVTVSWEKAITGEQKLEAVITQKWLALYPAGSEAWCDFRRTGYPRIIPAVSDLSSASAGGSVQNPVMINPATPEGAVRMVRRLPYPNSEYKGNPANVQNAVNKFLGGKDELSTNLWWSKNN